MYLIELLGTKFLLVLTCSAVCAPPGRDNVEIFKNWNFGLFRPLTCAARIVLATCLIELIGTKIPDLPARYACLG